jgi:hypothetical protein
MLGSDAPCLFFTNVLLIVGYIFHFCIILPKLRVIEDERPTSFLWFLSTAAIFWSSAVLGTLTVVTLWISAMMDPGILPPVPSPIKATVPGDHVPLGDRWDIVTVRPATYFIHRPSNIAIRAMPPPNRLSTYLLLIKRSAYLYLMDLYIINTKIEPIICAQSLYS